MRNFAEEEEVVEETTETVEEGAPDAHGQFVQLLEDMGLSAEQAEAIHQMAMDLVNNAPEEGGNEGERVEASRHGRRRTYSGRPGRKRMGMKPKRRGMSAEGRDRMERGPRGRRDFGRREFSDIERLERTVARQRRQLSKMREQLEQMGQRPGATKLSTAPNVNTQALSPGVGAAGDAKSRVFEMMKGSL